MIGFRYKEIRIVAILIPVVGLLIALIYGTSRTELPVYSNIFFALHSILVTAGIWMGCYAIVTFLWRKYPWERHPVKHIVIEVFAILGWIIVFGYSIHSIEKACHILPDSADINSNASIDIFLTILITFFITSIHEAVFFYQQWKINFSKSARLEKDNIEAKYETLKSQINPHFLFNSLNSLTLIVDENEEAVNYIQNLSEFLRYVLKSRDRELVLVRDEVKILNKYFSLQKSRFRDNLIIEVDIDEKYYHYSLPPLVLQMLVENCIKHNIIAKDKKLTINVKAAKDFISVENNLQKKTEIASTKQGLKNIIDRLKFFTSREVKIEENAMVFRVEIPLLTVEL